MAQPEIDIIMTAGSAAPEIGRPVREREVGKLLPSRVVLSRARRLRHMVRPLRVADRLGAELDVRSPAASFWGIINRRAEGEVCDGMRERFDSLRCQANRPGV